MNTHEDLQALLREYRQVEAEIDAMEADRQSLRLRIQEVMTAAGHDTESVTVDDETLFLVLEHRSEISYQEDTLRERLGEKYIGILDPDPRKLRRCPPEVRVALEPYLDRIGSPSRQRIRQAIETGALQASLFEGAYEKKRKTILYVKKRAPLGAADAASS